MTQTLPLGHEPLGLELGAERLEAEWRFRVIHENNVTPTLTLPLQGGGLGWGWKLLRSSVLAVI